MSETQYQDLIKKALAADPRSTRNGAITYATFGHSMEFFLERDAFPLLTTKKVFFRGIVEELLWMFRGSTDATELASKKIHIWDGHTSRDHLDKSMLETYKEGDTGPLYGFQWRHSGATYKTKDDDYTGQGVDQIENLINGLRSDPYSRRHVVSAWAPQDLSDMVLSPCHCLFQFFVEDDGGLSCSLYQRSGDIGLGVPFNIASYSLLLKLIAIAVGRSPKRFVHVLGDAHVYEEHVGSLSEQAQLEPFKFPTLTIEGVPENIESMSTKDTIKWIEGLSLENFKLHDYKHHKHQKMDLII